MRAFVQTGYGSADVIEPRELDVPSIAENEVLISVRAASLAAGDAFMMRGRPFPGRFSVGFPTPRKNHVVGLDCAGSVAAIGAAVTQFNVGDAVFGECRGSCAEFACADAGQIARKPESASFEEAAAMPTSACAALQAVRDQAKVRPGQHVLINGASGGVGPFAVQIAKSFGAEVTGVCSTGNVELVRSLGADHVIDYTLEDFTAGGPRFDAIIDNVASHSLSEARRALVPGGVHVPSSGHGGMRWIITASLTAPFVREQGVPFLATTNSADLDVLAGLIDSGAMKVVIDKTFGFSETTEAFRYVDAGHAKGKVVIDIDSSAR